MTASVRATALGLVLLNLYADPAQSQQVVVPGPGDDVRVSVVAPDGPAGGRVMVFDRFTAQPPSATLWLSQAAIPAGEWTEPTQLQQLGGPRAMPGLVPVAGGWALIHAWAASMNAILIQRAIAGPDLQFVDAAAILTGWPAGTRYHSPSVSVGIGGELLLAYTVQVLFGSPSDAAFVARSTDDGQTWDTGLAQASIGAAGRPRLARRSTDGLVLLAFHRERDTGGYDIHVRTSNDPLAWSSPEIPLTSDGDNQTPFPIVLADGGLATLWSRSVGGGAAQLWASWSRDGATWSAPAALPVEGTGPDTHPVALPTAAGGRIELYWARGAENDRDIYRQDQVLVIDPLWSDGFETP